MTFPARYHDTAVLLFTTDGISPRAIAGRFGALESEVRAVLIASGAMGSHGLNAALPAKKWRASSAAAPSSLPQYFDEDQRAEADRAHVNAIIRELRGRGFPFYAYETRPQRRAA